jgi:hypoxanthine phosphoribosyltransferase
MNIHDVASIQLGGILNSTLSDGRTIYWRSFNFIDSKGERILSVDTITDNGYNLLVTDPVLDEMNAPLKKAA